MKNIKIKIALISVLLATAPSIGAMAGFVVKGLHQPMLHKASSLWGAKKRYTEKLLAGLQEKAKNGIVPSRKDLADFDNSCEYNKYWIANSPDADGRTLFNYVYNNCANSVERSTLIRLLSYRGAGFNDRFDKFAMGPKVWLKANLGLSPEASATTTLAAARRSFTKNIKVGNQSKKFAEIKKTYAATEKDLLAAANKERFQKQIEAPMPVY